MLGYKIIAIIEIKHLTLFLIFISLSSVLSKVCHPNNKNLPLGKFHVIHYHIDTGLHQQNFQKEKTIFLFIFIINICSSLHSIVSFHIRIFRIICSIIENTMSHLILLKLMKTLSKNRIIFS